MKDAAVLKKYIRDISKYSLLTRDEEIEIALRIRKGDEKSKQIMINSNLRLVVKISIQFYRGSVPLMDIIQNGNMGLMRAAVRYDPDRGVKFSTYSAFWIKQSILRGFIKPSYTTNVSYRKDMVNRKIKRYIRDYFAMNDRFPTVEEIIEEVQVCRRDAVDILFFFQNTIFSLNETNFDEHEEIIETIADNTYNPEEVAEFHAMLEEVDNIVDSFNERDREIIKKRYGFDDAQKETLEEVGSKFSISAEAARQIELRILRHIKKQYPYLASYYA